MTDRSDPLGLRRFPITFEKGVLQSLEDSAVPNGYAPRIENWVPMPTGGLRCRPGWGDNGGGGPATSKVVGMAYHGRWGRFILANYTSGLGGTITLYRSVTGSPADTMATFGSTITGVPESNVQFAMGQHTLAFGGPQLAKLYGIDPTGTMTDSGTDKVPQNVYGFAYHHDAFYAGGGNDRDGNSRPSRLFWTDPGDGALSDWPANNWIDVGLPGGDNILSLGVHRDDLVIGKTSSLWLLQGTPEDALDLHRLDIGNAMPGNSIASTPFGAVIAGYDSVYLFDGSDVQRLGRPIEGTYPLGVNSTAWGDIAYFDNKVYITNALDGYVWVFNFETGGWTVETTAKPIRRLLSYAANSLFYLVGGPISSAMSGSGVIYRQRLAPPAYFPDFGSGGEAFVLRTPEYWLGTAVQRVTVRYVDLQLRQRQTGGSGLVVTPTVDSVAKTAKTVAAQASAGSFRTRVDFSKVGLTGYGFQFAFTTTPTSAQAAFDIESAVILYELEGAQA